MRIITGYMPASEGKVVVAGYDVFDKPIEAKRRTGYLPETPPLYPDMTVREYLTFVAKIKGVPRREMSVARRRVDEEDAGRRHGRAATARSSRRAIGSGSAWRRRSSTTPTS